MIKNKVVLVTGGAGFIGSNLCESLLSNNNIVKCLDNFATGKRENIEPFLSNPNFTLIEGDIRDLNTCKNVLLYCIKNLLPLTLDVASQRIGLHSLERKTHFLLKEERR